jgi:hypothetical protein
MAIATLFRRNVPRRASDERKAKRLAFARKVLRSQPLIRVSVWAELATLLRDFTPALALAIIRDSHTETNPVTGEQRRPNDIVGLAADAWSLQVRNGEPLSDAVQGWVGRREQMMIAVGEQSGQLGEVIRRMAAAEKTIQTLRASWISGLRLPAVLTVWTWITLPGYAYFTIWQLAQYPEIHNPWTLLALSISNIILRWVSWIVPLTVALVALWLRWVTLHWFSPKRADWEHIWPLSLYKAMAATDFLLPLSILKFAGYRNSQALKAIRQTASPYLQWQIDAIEENSRSKTWGETLALADRRFPATQENALMAIFSLNPETYPDHLQQLTADWIEKLEQRLEANKAATIFATMVLIGILTVISSVLLMVTALPV